MKTRFHGKRITGLLGVVPETLACFQDEVSNYTFPAKQTLRLQKVMGFKTHRVAKTGTATSDLCVVGLDYLFKRKLLCKEEVGALIVACSYPDYFIPPVSSVLHGHFHFGKEVFCIDISQGCVGFLIALNEAFLLLEHMEPGKKAIVFAADVLSKKVSKQDRNSYPLVGDGAGIAIVENDANASDISVRIYNNGSARTALQIPAGGSRMPSTQETAIRRDMQGDGNLRSLDDLCMNGSEVFTFVQTEVPPMIEEILQDANLQKEEIDWFLFHQPNKFMLRKLAEKIGVPYEKMPMDLVENLGNSSGACIPINAAYALGEQLQTDKYTCCLSAFGSGLTWAAMTMELGELNFCDLYISDC